MSDIQTADAFAPASDNPLPVSQVAEIQNDKEEDFNAALDDDLSKVWRKNNPDRDDDGRYTSRDGEKPEEAAGKPDEKPGDPVKIEGQEPKEETAEQAKPAIEPPSSWPREMREKWALLPPETQEHIARRESESHSAITRLGQVAKAYEPVAQVVEQNRELFQARNLSPDQGIAQMLAFQRQLDMNPITAIHNLARVYGVNLGDQTAQSTGEQNASDPQIVALQHYIANLEARLNQTASAVNSRQQMEIEQRNAAIFKQAEDFIQKNQITSAEEEAFAVYVSAERQISPDKDPVVVLQSAFDKWQYAEPSRRQAILAKQQAEAEKSRQEEAAKKAVEAKKAGSINVRSTPAKDTTPQSWDDELRGIYRKTQSR